MPPRLRIPLTILLRNQTPSKSAHEQASSPQLKTRLCSKSSPRRRNPPLVPTTSVLPDVIEITATETKRNSVIAATLQEEVERERLRDAAAHSIGLDPELMSRSPTSVLDSYDFGYNGDSHESDHDREAETEHRAGRIPNRRVVGEE